MTMNNTRAAVFIILGLLATLSVYYVTTHRRVVSSVPVNTKFSSENVQVQNVDVSTGKLPAAFPANIPIELANVTDSSILSYPDRHAEVDNVTYFSIKQQEELFSIYGAYFKANGYKVTNTSKKSELMMYQATKGNTEVSVSITPGQGRMLVLVSVVVRQ
jgi:hypothetical protein